MAAYTSGVHRSQLSIELFESNRPLSKPPVLSLFGSFFTFASEENRPSPLSTRAWQELINRQRWYAVGHLSFLAVKILLLAATCLIGIVALFGEPLQVIVAGLLLGTSFYSNFTLSKTFELYKESHNREKSQALTQILIEEHQKFYDQNTQFLRGLDKVQLKKRVDKLQNYYKAIGVINSSQRLQILAPYISLLAPNLTLEAIQRDAAYIDAHFPYPLDYMVIRRITMTFEQILPTLAREIFELARRDAQIVATGRIPRRPSSQSAAAPAA